jgi:hypothetical protein
MDLSIYLLWPDPSQEVAYNEDNAVQHKCRHHQDIRDWAEEHKVHALHNGTVAFDNMYFPELAEYLG